MPRTAQRSSSYRLVALAGLVIGLQGLALSSAAQAQSNPLDNSSENPLDRQGELAPFHGPAVLDLPMILEGEGLTLELADHDLKTSVISGQVRMGANAYPFTGQYESPTRFKGAFQAGGKPYDFVLEGAQAQGYTFTTGNSTYALRDTMAGQVHGQNQGGTNGQAADPAQLKRASDAMVASDFATALQITRPLAEQGHVGASYMVGICTAFGMGTEQDLNAAKAYFETAARGNHPRGLFRLGDMEAEGVFGQPDNASAASNFEKAARLGITDAMLAYGEMLINGLGRQEDFAEGVAWAGVAAERGNQNAKQLLEYYKQDQNVTQEVRQRVTKRIAELGQTLPDAEKLDDLIAYNRFVTPVRKTGQDKKREQPQAVDPLAGDWSGTLTEQMDNGQTMRAPMTIKIAPGQNGSYSADVVVNVQMPGDYGDMIDVRATGRFQGQLQNGRAVLKAQDTTATIVKTGESGSMGPQQMEFTVNGNSIRGQLGNEYDGYSPFQATRQSAPANQSGNAGWEGMQDTRGGSSTELGRPGADGGVNSAASVTLEPVTLTDAQMGNAPSHTLLVPQGWRREGGVRWNNPQLFLDMVHMDLRVTAPDGVAYGYYPGATYTWSDIFQINAQMGISNEIPQPGQITGEGLTFMPMPQTTGDYVQTMLIPKHRPGATNVQVVSAQEMPDVMATMRQMLAPTFRSMEQHNQSMGQMGGGQMDMPLFADRVKVTYQEGGQMFEEEVYVTGYAVITRMPMANGVTMTMARWGVEDIRTVRAPVGGSPNKAIADAASLSVRPDPKWLATIMQLRAQINKTVTDGIIERGRITREGMQKSFEIHQESVRSQQASNDRMHHQFINYIRDVDDFKTPSGKTVQLPSNFNNAYMNGQGQVVMTNNTLSSSSGWTQLNRAR